MQRSKSDSEEKTIVAIEIVADNLRKQAEVLDVFVRKWHDSKDLSGKEGGDGREFESTRDE